MADFALDENDELVFEHGDLTFVYDDDYIVQRLRIALRHSVGEWFRDLNSGTDYIGSILGKSTDLSRRAEFRRRALQVPGIRDVAAMDLTIGSDRKLSGTISLIKDDGTPLEVKFQRRRTA